jgi:hypothetical protein
MAWPWRLAIAVPLGLFAASFVLNLLYPDCGYAGAPPCELNWIYEWKDYTYFLGSFAAAVLVFVAALRAIDARFPVWRAPWAVLALVLPWAYAAGWFAHLFLNDDPPCLYSPQAGDRLDETAPYPEILSEWWPVRTNCRIPLVAGGYRFEQGDARIFLSVFGFWLVIGLLAVMPGRLWVRAVAGLAAFVGSVLFMFL